MNRYILAGFALALALSHETSARAFWCQNRTVHIGDPARVVHSLCGDPTQISERIVTRTVEYRQRVSRGVVVREAVTVTVALEIWLYDFGPRKLMQELAFEGGRVIAIEGLGYGTRDGREAQLERRSTSEVFPAAVIPAPVLVARASPVDLGRDYASRALDAARAEVLALAATMRARRGSFRG